MTGRIARRTILRETRRERGCRSDRPKFYKDQSIDLELRSDVAGIDAKGRQVSLASGRSIPFDKLLLATGAEPVRLDIPGADQPHVHALRSLADSRAIIAKAKAAKRAV